MRSLTAGELSKSYGVVVTRRSPQITGLALEQARAEALAKGAVLDIDLDAVAYSISAWRPVAQLFPIPLPPLPSFLREALGFGGKLEHPSLEQSVELAKRGIIP